MAPKREAEFSPRKRPRQARSRQMQDDIVAGAIRVLAKHGAEQFTTIRVADEAGVSVGSLYQYYPNKESLLVGVHEREMREAWDAVQGILDGAEAPRERVRRLVLFFFASEAGEAPRVRALVDQARDALGESAPGRALLAQAHARIRGFLDAALAGSGRVGDLDLATAVVIATIESVGKSVARRGLDEAGVKRWAEECAAMVCRYVGLE